MSILSIPDEGYSRNAPCVLNLISTLSLMTESLFTVSINIVYEDDVIRESGTAYLSGAPVFTPGFSGVCVVRSLVMFCRSFFFFFLFFPLAIALSVHLRFTDSDYPFRHLQILTFDLHNILYEHFILRNI